MKSTSLMMLLCSILVGCNTNLYNFDKKLGKLGIAVDMQASRDSVCLQEQMVVFNQDYKSLKRSEKKKLQKALADKYNTVVVLPSTQSQKIEGIKQVFSYVIKQCGDSSCWYKELASKVLEENLQVTGENPKTSATVDGNTLTIQAQYKTDYSVIKKYYTRSVEAYDKIETIEQARSNSEVWNQDTLGKDREKCGQTIRLKEIL